MHIVLLAAALTSPALAQEAPRTLDQAIRDLRAAEPEETVASMRTLLAVEEQTIDSLVRRLADPKTRDQALAELVAEDEEQAEFIASGLPPGKAPEAAVRAVIGPFLLQHWTFDVTRALSERMRSMASRHEKELRAILRLAPNDTAARRRKKLELVQAWHARVEPARRAGEDPANFPKKRDSATSPIDKHVRPLWKAHLELKPAADRDLRGLFTQKPAALLERMQRADAWHAAWTAGKDVLADRDGLELRPLEELGPPARLRSGRALALVANDRLPEARELLAEGADDYDRTLLRFAFRMRIAKYNDELELTITKPGRDERDVVRRMNDYRLALGLEPLEIDERLVAAARGHSAEMAEMDYFAHESPVAERKSAADRLRLAGYENGRTGECIFKGSTDGEVAFLAWFHSFGHHQIIVWPDLYQVGVGRAGKLYTANFGGGCALER